MGRRELLNRVITRLTTTRMTRMTRMTTTKRKRDEVQKVQIVCTRRMPVSKLTRPKMSACVGRTAQAQARARASPCRDMRFRHRNRSFSRHFSTWREIHPSRVVLGDSGFGVRVSGFGLSSRPGRSARPSRPAQVQVAQVAGPSRFNQRGRGTYLP